MGDDPLTVTLDAVTVTATSLTNTLSESITIGPPSPSPVGVPTTFHITITSSSNLGPQSSISFRGGVLCDLNQGKVTGIVNLETGKKVDVKLDPEIPCKEQEIPGYRGLYTEIIIDAMKARLQQEYAFRNTQPLTLDETQTLDEEIDLDLNNFSFALAPPSVSFSFSPPMGWTDTFQITQREDDAPPGVGASPSGPGPGAGPSPGDAPGAGGQAP